MKNIFLLLFCASSVSAMQDTTALYYEPVDINIENHCLWDVTVYFDAKKFKVEYSELIDKVLPRIEHLFVYKQASNIHWTIEAQTQKMVHFYRLVHCKDNIKDILSSLRVRISSANVFPVRYGTPINLDPTQENQGLSIFYDKHQQKMDITTLNFEFIDVSI